MRPRFVLAVLITMSLLTGVLLLSHAQDTLAQGQSSPPVGAQRGTPFGFPAGARPALVCPGPAAPGTARCHSRVWTDANGNPLATSVPAGYGPGDLQGAYNLSSASAVASSATVAIVDAYDDPNAESDLAVYRSQFGLPACTTANGCFRKIDQNGGTRYPRANAGWAQEISLDLDMVSAICPNCHILLVEAGSNSFANLAAAVNYAATVPGVVAISNSYGANEFSAETSSTYNEPYNHPGKAVTASSGDNGYGVEFPAASQYVTAVGGTSLSRCGDPNRGFCETVWNGAGSGCSAYVTKPLWQTDTGCSRRTVADVSAVADPSTGVAVYDTYGGRFYGAGWMVFGGTSVASPIIASVYALAGNTSSISSGSYPYAHTTSLFDVTTGSNGSCGGTYLCTGGTGYDGPTGNGTPNGSSAF
jgi:subtilase family serine protease